MEISNEKLTPKIMKLDTGEKYTRLFSTKEKSALSFRSGHVILGKNENIGKHDTGDSEEILIILEGKGRLYINGNENINFEKNTALYVPPKTTHDVINTGQCYLKYIFVTARI